MKRLLLACFLLTAACAPMLYSVQATAHPVAATPVTQADFTAKVNLMDAQIGAGNITAAQATWNEIHQMMLAVLATTKYSIRDAATPAAKDSYMAIMNNQTTIYYAIWALKTDLATNKVAIHTKLGEFNATIY